MSTERESSSGVKPYWRMTDSERHAAGVLPDDPEDGCVLMTGPTIPCVTLETKDGLVSIRQAMLVAVEERTDGRDMVIYLTGGHRVEVTNSKENWRDVRGALEYEVE